MNFPECSRVDISTKPGAEEQRFNTPWKSLDFRSQARVCLSLWSFRSNGGALFRLSEKEWSEKLRTNIYKDGGVLRAVKRSDMKHRRFSETRLQSLGIESSSLKVQLFAAGALSRATLYGCFVQGFDDHKDSGVYLCSGCYFAGQQAQGCGRLATALPCFRHFCQVPLYTSSMKFDCGCGWPGFWTNVKARVSEQDDPDKPDSGRAQDEVYEQRDADGRRHFCQRPLCTSLRRCGLVLRRCEILCSKCQLLKRRFLCFPRDDRFSQAMVIWVMSSVVRHPAHLLTKSGASFLLQGFGYCTDERHCVNSLSLVSRTWLELA